MSLTTSPLTITPTPVVCVCADTLSKLFCATERERGKKEKGRCEAEYIEWFALMERSTSAEGDAKYHR